MLTVACTREPDAEKTRDERVSLPASPVVLRALNESEIFFARLIIDGNRDDAQIFSDLKVANGEISGELTLRVSIGNHTFQLEYVVVRDDEEIVIARTELKEYFISPGSNNIVNFVDESDPLNRGLFYPDDDEDGRRNVEEINFDWNPRKANPEAPVNVRVTPLDANVNLSWDSVTGAIDYTVYMASEADIDIANFGGKLRGMRHPGIVDTHFSHPDGAPLENDVTYYFVVTARNEFGESLESMEVSATPQPAGATLPAAPVLSGSPLDSNVRLAWSPVTGATSYVVYMASTSGVTKENVQELNGMRHANATSPWNHPNPGLANGTNWCYVITAANTLGESVESNEVCLPVQAPAVVPSAPDNVSLLSGNGSATLSWTAPPESAAGFTIYYRNQPNVTKTNSTAVNVNSPGITSYQLEPLVNGRSYYVAISARNSDGAESGLSAQVMGTPLGPWQEQNIGAPIAGSSSGSDGSFTVTGGGVDIYNTADEFYFVYQALPNNRVFTAQLTSQISTSSSPLDPWAKAGLMFRQSVAVDSKYTFLMHTAENGVLLQSREQAGVATKHNTFTTGNLPLWFRLIRLGNVIEAQVSADGNNWRLLGVVSNPVLNDPLLVGMAVTSHNTSTATAELSTAAFENVSITDGSDLNIQLPQNPEDITGSIFPLAQNSGNTNKFYVLRGLTANARYSVEALFPSADVDIMAYNAGTRDFLCGSFIDGSINDSCVALADASGNLYLRVNGSNAGSGGANFELNVTPYAFTAASVGVVLNQTIDRSFKYYEVSGVTPGTRYTISLSNLSMDVDLYVYRDEFRSPAYYKPVAGTADEKFSIGANSDKLYFRVDGSKLPAGGSASYDVLVQ